MRRTLRLTPLPRWGALLRRGLHAFDRVVGRGRNLAHRFAEPDGFERRELLRSRRHFLDRPLRARSAGHAAATAVVPPCAGGAPASSRPASAWASPMSCSCGTTHPTIPISLA